MAHLRRELRSPEFKGDVVDRRCEIFYRRQLRVSGLRAGNRQTAKFLPDYWSPESWSSKTVFPVRPPCPGLCASVNQRSGQQVIELFDKPLFARNRFAPHNQANQTTLPAPYVYEYPSPHDSYHPWS